MQQVWNKKMDDFFFKNNFTQFQFAYSVHIKSKGIMKVVFLALYVDDLLIF